MTLLLALAFTNMNEVGGDTVWWVVVGVGATISVFTLMRAKNKRAHENRTDNPESIEARQDVAARAAAFVDALYAGIALLLVNAFVPGYPGWLICFVLLAIMLVAYWLRRTSLYAKSSAGRET